VLDDPTGLPEVAVRTGELAGLGPSSPWGLDALRHRIAERLGAIGLPSTAEQVLVTTGAQQGLALAMACWVRPGDRVVVDDPTYPGVLGAVAAAGARAIGVPVDRHGPHLEQLAAALGAGPALLSVQSGPHSPTGGRASEHRRRAIASLAVDHRVPVVEDHALFALDWSGRRTPAPIAAQAPDHPIAVVGSYSKRFWSGLRVGFVRAPAPVARRLARVKAVHDLGSSIPAQALALGLLEHPDHERFVAERNGALARRADLLVRLLDEALPRWKVAAPDGGLSLWVALPEPVAARFADIARRHGVVVATAEGLSADPERHRDRLRLTFARPEAELREGVRRLASAWDDLT
jgi:DNA-binding transcriptional MocR family regulator